MDRQPSPPALLQIMISEGVDYQTAIQVKLFSHTVKALAEAKRLRPKGTTNKSYDPKQKEWTVQYPMMKAMAGKTLRDTFTMKLSE
jgi:hypothetical protein